MDVGQLAQPLIPGLPDDIAVDCLIRVPYRLHSDLRSVCRGWRNLTASASFYRERHLVGAAESLVCLIQAVVPQEEKESGNRCGSEGKDEEAAEKSAAGGGGHQKQQSWAPPTYGLTLYNATLGSWHRLAAPAAVPLFAQCVAVPSAAKLVILGGWDPATLEPLPSVLVVDMVSGRARRGRPMSTARTFFACAAVGGVVYVAGGHDNQKNALRTAEAYDVQMDEWRSLPAMAEERDECRGLALGGKFWAVSGYSTEQQGSFDRGAECYDPATGQWVKEEGMPWAGGGEDADVSLADSTRSCYVVVPDAPEQGRVWHLECGTEKREAREYDEVQRRWKVIAGIPESLKSIPSVAVIGGDGVSVPQVFVMGSDKEQQHRGWVMDARTKKWRQVDTPAGFSGFAYSATTLRL